MKVGDIEILPLASESLGVRSLCTQVVTPDLSVIFDPSAALARRRGLEPHPEEYRTLMRTLESIFVATRKSDVISISHYHYDHVRPGFTDFQYNLSSGEELQRMFDAKLVLAKDNRENINPSQRRRGFYFQRDVADVVDEIQWCDNHTYEFGSTRIKYSPPLPHGPSGSRLGFVVASLVEYEDSRVLFAPDVQGPVERDSLAFLLALAPHLAIIGGPPIYLDKFEKKHEESAMFSLLALASQVPILVVDHHLLRSLEWSSWLSPVKSVAKEAGNKILPMAELAGMENACLEAKRQKMYELSPPSDAFLAWTSASDEYKKANLPPMDD